MNPEPERDIDMPDLWDAQALFLLMDLILADVETNKTGTAAASAEKQNERN
jgi:hypothetical protein